MYSGPQSSLRRTTMASPKRVLITGATGLLGRAIFAAFKESAGLFEPIGVGFSRGADVRCDLRDPSAIATMIEEQRPHFVVHAAAERRPDACETDETGATERLNVDAVFHLARQSSQHKASFLYISTDYVFDGSSAPYSEDSKTHPLNAYGFLKLRGEWAALAGHGRAIVLRVPVLYGPSEDASESAITVFAKTVVESHSPRTLDDWQSRQPTYTPDIGATIVNFAKRLLLDGDSASSPGSLAGIWHYGGKETTTRYQVALMLGRLLGLPTDHIKGDASPPSGAPRPKNAFLSSDKIEAAGLAAPFTPFEEGMARVLAGFEVMSAAAVAADGTTGAEGTKTIVAKKKKEAE